MGTIKAEVIINAVAKTLQDETNVKWGRLELLEYLNDGQREIVLAKPDAYSVNETVTLISGTKQTLPGDGILFLRMNRNMGVGGNTPGRAPRFIKMQILDEQIPNWHADAPNATVLHYTFDDKDPRRFYVYPPQPAANPNKVEIIYSAAPPEVQAEGDPITVNDLWKTALEKYMEFRAYSKDADYAREDAVADRAYKIFIMLVGVRENVDAKVKESR